MPLEKFFQESQKIDVKKLSVETPETKPELPFDPEKEIMEEDWERILNRWQELRRQNDWVKLVRYMANIKIISPEKASQLPMPAIDAVGKAMDIMAESLAINKPEKIVDVAKELADIKMFFPEQLEYFSLTDEQLEALKFRIEEYRVENNLTGLIQYSLGLEILCPGTLEEMNIYQDYKKPMLEWLGELQRRGNWRGFAARARDIKILFSGKFSHIDPPMWVKMKESLNGFRGMTDTFVSQAADMKILAAEEVKITDKGLELVMSKPKEEFQSPTPPMPEKRKF